MNILTLPLGDALKTQTLCLKSRQAPNLIKMNCLCILPNTYFFNEKKNEKNKSKQNMNNRINSLSLLIICRISK